MRTAGRRSRYFRAFVASAVFVWLRVGLFAQDTRTVLEPTLPPACTRLTAILSAPDGALAPADETRLDTDRIQRALDRCGAGRADELVADRARNAFLSGPLDLRQGV